MEKKNVLIATYNNSKNNYGGVFQAFALSETVKRIGHEVRFVTIENPNGIYRKKRSLELILKNWIVSILSLPTRSKRLLREKKFSEFKNKTQQRVCFKDYDALMENPPEADVYLSGSDQVWNPLSLRKDFYFPYAPENKIVISYAASMGCEKIPNENRTFFEKSIARYDAISVREDTMVGIISPLTSKTVHHHIDPVFLIESQRWDSMAKEYKKLKYDRYILLYLINWNKANTPQLLKLKKEMNLPLVLITLGGRKPSYADQVIMDASPEEFLYLLKNAELVVASSFHGVALSIIMNKPFIAVSGQHYSSRIQSLLRYLDLQKHDTLEMTADNALFDSVPVAKKIQVARQEAMGYLSDAIMLEKESRK